MSRFIPLKQWRQKSEPPSGLGRFDILQCGCETKTNETPGPRKRHLGTQRERNSDQ
jgi:hypothetical protein